MVLSVVRLMIQTSTTTERHGCGWSLSCGPDQVALDGHQGDMPPFEDGSAGE